MKWLCLIIILSVCNIAEAFNVNKSKQLVIEKGERAYLVFNNNIVRDCVSSAGKIVNHYYEYYLTAELVDEIINAAEE